MGDNATNPATIVLTRRDIASLMAPGDYLAAVEAGVRACGEGHAQIPPPVHVTAGEGTFHAKSALLRLDRPYVGVKWNGNFPGNPQRGGLPTIQGVVVLCDGSDGTVLAVMDSIEITLRRTAAATALAARHLANPGSDTLALCGCGAQGRAHLEAIAGCFALRRALVYDVDHDKAQRFAREMQASLDIEVDAVGDAREATLRGHVVVTATTARTPFLAREMVAPGALIAAIGADNESKSELAPTLFADATIVVDLKAQAAAMGDLHHAIAAGVVAADDVHAEIADIVVGRMPGRTRGDEVIVFDSTGIAVQDVAVAAAIWQRAIERNTGSFINFGAQ